jgi:hypothetical protein
MPRYFTVLTNYVEQSPSKDYSCSAGQEVPRLLWNLKFHYRVHKTVIDPYPEPDKSSLHPHKIFL